MKRGEHARQTEINGFNIKIYRQLPSEALEARSLGEWRKRWLNSAEWSRWVDEPGSRYPKRPVPRDEDAAEALKRRTLTNLDSARPSARRCGRRP